MNVIDDVETLLAHLICTDFCQPLTATRTVGGALQHSAIDGGTMLPFAPMQPTDCYTAQRDADRIYTASSDMLLAPPQDYLGEQCEIALLCTDRVKWLGYRQLRRRPKQIWLAKQGASLYEVHYREIFPDGRSTYGKRVAAIDSAGRPVATVIIGTRSEGGGNDAECLVLAASLIEDAHRPNALLARISEAGAIRVPVPIGEHREVFAVRDAPLTKAGRRRAILHWVAKHTRAAPSRRIDVCAHWRGTRTMTVDGMTVELTPNGVPGAF